MGIRLLGSRVLIRQAKKVTMSEGGIALSLGAEEQPLYGEVIAVGPGDYAEDGSFVKTTVKEGDTVMYTPGTGEVIEFEGEEYLLAGEGQLVGVLV